MQAVFEHEQGGGGGVGAPGIPASSTHRQGVSVAWNSGPGRPPPSAGADHEVGISIDLTADELTGSQGGSGGSSLPPANGADWYDCLLSVPQGAGVRGSRA